jgi:F420-dependent oxidoreductase-like protein
MKINLMIEGQEDVTWGDWAAIASACDKSGLEGLFRSDHYASVQGRTERGSLDAWTTLAGLAAITSRVRLGTLVSPVTFRHPSALAKAVATVDHISGGRVELGLGAGWFADEHSAYGFDFPPTLERIAMLAEQLEIISRQWTTQEPFDFSGAHYVMKSCEAHPRPLQQPRPPIIVGGSGGERTAALSARWADEYNTTFASPMECRARRERIAQAWEIEGRDPGSLRFSIMTGVVVGGTEQEVLDRARRVMELGGETGDPRRWLQDLGSSWVVGTAGKVTDRLGELGEAGVDRAMLQNQLAADTDVIAFLSEDVLPQLP